MGKVSWLKQLVGMTDDGNSKSFQYNVIQSINELWSQKYLINNSKLVELYKHCSYTNTQSFMENSFYYMSFVLDCIIFKVFLQLNMESWHAKSIQMSFEITSMYMLYILNRSKFITCERYSTDTVLIRVVFHLQLAHLSHQQPDVWSHGSTRTQCPANTRE